jgi:hypothetical protein
MNAFVNGLLTVLTSGVVSALATTIFNFRQSERQLRRNKLEELSVIVRKHQHRLKRMTQVARDAMKGDKTREQAEAAIKDIGKDNIDDTFKVSALVAIYFPQLSEQIADIRKAESQFEQVRDDPANRTWEKLTAVMDNVVAAHTKMMEAILVLGPKVNSSLWMFWR